MNKGLETVEGIFSIEAGCFFMDDKEIEDCSIVHLSVTKIKQIIKDAKAGVI